MEETRDHHGGGAGDPDTGGGTGDLPRPKSARKPDTGDSGDYFPYGNRDVPTRPEDADPYWYDRDRHQWRKPNGQSILGPDEDANERADADNAALSDGYADTGT